MQLAKLSFNHSIGRTHSWRFSTFYKIPGIFICCRYVRDRLSWTVIFVRMGVEAVWYIPVEYHQTRHAAGICVMFPVYPPVRNLRHSLSCWCTPSSFLVPHCTANISDCNFLFKIFFRQDESAVLKRVIVLPSTINKNTPSYHIYQLLGAPVHIIVVRICNNTAVCAGLRENYTTPRVCIQYTLGEHRRLLLCRTCILCT